MPSPKTFLAERNIRPKKQLGQNFLTDPGTANIIVSRSEILPDDIVLEIGAGLGALTIPLAQAAKKVYAVEKDQRIIEICKTELCNNKVTNVILIENDILEVDIKELAKNERRKIIVMGNLPYNISSQIIIQLINSRSAVNRAVLMFQKELAQRITAKQGGKDYGRLTVMLRYCAEIDKLANVKASLFFPKPRVDSELLEIKFKDFNEHPANDEDFLFRVIKAAFSKRRKTLKNALIGSELDIDAKTALRVLKNTNINPVRRAETLTVQEFVKLSNTLGDSIRSI